ncbi:MAG: site-2 protease family protein [Gammaproteobacteria bacterium]|nr:MAG: site-2 protease family protein [Gammaproteobacteria bacterium]RLA12881.1 MAG: site-2 protease family protein [Gammaproteobacteria bacterium]
MEILVMLVVAAPPIILAITVHEAAHAYAADALGDSTARQMGRLSLNPFRHIDPVGTVLLPLVLLMTTGFLFGWAKPVPVQFGRLRNPQRDMALVGGAGPASNLAMAVFWGLVLKISMGFSDTSSLAMIFEQMANIGVMINLVLMVLNMLPVPPLDGSRVVVGFLSPQNAAKYLQIERHSMLVMIGLVVLIATGYLSKILVPLVSMAKAALFTLLGVSY